MSITKNTLDLDANQKSMVALPATVITMLAVFIWATIIHVKHNSHFISDDLKHFFDATKESFFEFICTPIDVHFVPLHKLSSFALFKLAPLNFNAALGIMAIYWLIAVFVLQRILLRLTSQRAAWVFTLLIGASPVWIHNFIWWSSAAHRLPYLALQAASILFYMRFREREQLRDSFLCTAMQILALGFYIKAIFFPAIFVALEICLAHRDRKLSQACVKLCIFLAAISATYVFWYFFFAPVMRAPIGIGILEALFGAFQLLSRLGRLLIFFPVGQNWAIFFSGVIWSLLFGFLTWRKPSSALPLSALVVILIIGYGLTLSGRAGIMIDLPAAAMRYYADDLIVIAIFISLAIEKPLKTAPPSAGNNKNILRNAFLLIFVIAYPVGAYISNRTLVEKAYNEHKLTHEFMINLDHTLRASTILANSPTILATDFPAFAYGFMGMRLSMAEILKSAYPFTNWIQPENARDEVLQINNSGRLEPVVLPEKIYFRDNISFPNWHAAEDNHRWSRNKHATILFTPPENHAYKGLLTINGPVLGEQRVTVGLNGNEIGRIKLSDTQQCCKWSLQFEPKMIIKGINALEFELPDARQPLNGDTRVLAIGVSSIEFN